MHFLAHGFIQPSRSHWAAPILFAPKKDGGLRMCIDYRALNATTIKNRFPVPRVEELLDAVQGDRIFSKIDLRSSYHQIRVVSEDQDKPAFRTKSVLYEFSVLPFGLTNVPATFQILMNSVLAMFIGSFIVVYLDDILVYSRTPEEHLEHLLKIFEVLQKEQLYAKQSKWGFFLPEVKFLGHIVSAIGVRTYPKKIASVQQWTTPTSVKEQHSFLGFAKYYRRFVQGYASIASPLTNLLCKGAKQSLTSSPTLSYPDTTRPYVVVTDASDQAIGAVLLQDQGRGLQPIIYESRKLRGAELNYLIHNKEALAIIHAYKVWRSYLDGADSIIRTDHCSLRFLKSQPQLSRRQARWMEFMEGSFHYNIEYKPGVRNPADPLTRPSCQVTTEEAATLFVDNVVELHGFPDSIISDRDPLFTSKFWKQLFALFWTRLAMSSAYHPKTDGQTERVNQTFEQILRNITVHNAAAWDKKLSMAEFAYNNMHHSSTGMSPFLALYGQHPNVPTRGHDR
ncbi:hypothetical protein CLOM_g8308 [Closterium sp. NIES-68]|nr:hypothetical protein CLOM_g8308 [Closterium sp. NIES-68]